MAVFEDVTAFVRLKPRTLHSVYVFAAVIYNIIRINPFTDLL